MALFSKTGKSKDKEDKKEVAEVKETVAKKKSSPVTKTKKKAAEKVGEVAEKKAESGFEFIIKPHEAEKSALLSEKGVYVFRVKPSADKIKIAAEIKKVYGVTPKKVNMIQLPAKTLYIGRRKGTKAGMKKAIVFLEKGEKIKIA